jgi:hypothetical protein
MDFALKETQGGNIDMSAIYIYLQPIWSGHEWTSSYYLASGLTTSLSSLGKG